MHTTVDAYLGERTGTFERRAVRYRAALEALRANGLSDESTLYDIGAGWTELDVTLRVEGGWKGRYIPIDLGHDLAHDLESWVPPRPAEFAVALEVLEHLDDPWRLVAELQAAVGCLVVSVPNPRTVDVLGIDRTHRTVITAGDLQARGFMVREELFYGGVYSAGERDALFAVWVSA
ncbi:hypothetical protein HDC37_000965 [Microbacterium sp. AK009]|uniref:hypothetical protein n=1 Tax=Microbacterium sp. AK009 TaxID=2723068 RepID=UPI0015CC510B|nr:hypothetical protein [Microbacterium sp. AK009]NYF16151.1 hypothetical protein [Microbacterium sp. AK009]